MTAWPSPKPDQFAVQRSSDGICPMCFAKLVKSTNIQYSCRAVSVRSRCSHEPTDDACARETVKETAPTNEPTIDRSE